MKDYIKDNNRVKMCYSNIAKMNIFESMYYHRFVMYNNIIDTINDIKENWFILINIFIILILPLVYPFMSYWEIRRAKKEVEQCNAGKNN